MDHDFITIPGWERYAVNREGQVRSSRGPLSCDARARYSLRKSTGSVRFAVGTLMRMAGLFDVPGAQDAAELRAERDDLERQIEDLRAAMNHMADKHRAEQARGKADLASLKAELAAAKFDLARCRKVNGHLIRQVKSYEARLDERAAG